jgi:hypothetical protein
MEKYTLELIRYDGGEKEVIEDYDLGDENALIVTNDPVVGIGVAHYRTSPGFELRISDSCVIRQSYLKIARALCQKYRNVIPREVSPESICFTIDEDWEPSNNSNANSAWKIDITKATKWLKFFTGYRFEIKMRQWWINEWTPAQLHAAIFSQLLRINPKGNGTIKKYSLEFPDPLMATFGLGYLEKDIEINDPLDREITLKGFALATGQISINDTLAQEVESHTNKMRTSARAMREEIPLLSEEPKKDPVAKAKEDLEKIKGLSEGVPVKVKDLLEPTEKSSPVVAAEVTPKAISGISDDGYFPDEVPDHNNDGYFADEEVEYLNDGYDQYEDDDSG